MLESPRRATRWRILGGELPLGRRTLVMGIVNVTPDSFSDGGRFLNPDQAVAHALDLVEEGADLLDIGGESTRPGSEAVPEADERARVVPVLEALRRSIHVPLSVDTRKASVAEAAIRAGASIVNDVSALADPGMAPLVERSGAGLILMHMQGEPGTMQVAPRYDDVVREVADALRARARHAIAAGIHPESIALDPGLGFGKRTGAGVEDNLLLLKNVEALAGLGHPVVVGPSRKTFVGNATGKLPVGERLEGSLAAAGLAAWLGAHVVRVHDARATRRVVDFVDAVRTA